MGAPELVQLYVRLRSKPDGAYLAPPELKARIVADAQEKGTNAQAVAVAILARTYGVPADPSTRRKKPAESEDELVLWIPPELRLALDLASKHSGRGTAQQEARAALAAHYGLRLPAPPVRRRARRSGTAPAAA